VAKPAFPIPQLTEWNAPFFEGAKEDRLTLQRCADCKRLIYYPRIACPHCLSGSLAWETLEGDGTVYSFSIVRRPKSPIFDPLAPIILVAVELCEGPMVIATLEGTHETRVQIGLPVAIHFSAVEDGPPLMRFHSKAD
jgi:uncharacterized OB-fold protein